jgi:hypothetical protein
MAAGPTLSPPAPVEPEGAIVPSTTSTYVYDHENPSENTVAYYATDELMEGLTIDPLRKELGYEISIIDPETNEDGKLFMVKVGSFTTDIDPLRDMNFVKMTTNSPYIASLEISPHNIVQLSPVALLPNYSIPVRLYANEAASKGDKFWRTLFIGGEHAGETYPSLINTDTVFNDYFFTFANSYSTLYAKSIGIENSAENIHQISSIYNSHNINIKEHQKWATLQPSPLLIPAYHIFETIGEDGQTQMSTPLQQYIACTSSNSSFDIDMEGISESLDEIDENFVSQIGKSYMESFYLPKMRATQYSKDIKMVAVHSQRNLMFDSNYYSKSGYSHGDKVNNFPYYNIIKFNRQESGTHLSPGLGTEYDGNNSEKFFIRDAIEESNLSAKFLETLKDIHEKTWPSVRFSSKALSVEKSKLKLSDDATYGTETIKSLNRRNYRTIDLIKMFQTIYNNPEASLNSNYTFIGPDAPGYHTTYQDNKLYRYYDNQNLVGALDKIYDSIKSKYQFSADVTTWELSNQATLEDIQALMNFMFNPKIAHAETIAYRIEKSGGETFGDYNTTNVIQDYWIFNSKNADTEMKFFDTQIKYGQNYTYKCYAYVAVLGKRYKYSDFRLTKQIALLDQAVDGDGTGVHGIGASDGDVDYYCLQFYEPLSGDFADQFFNDGIGGGDWSAIESSAALNFESAMYGTESILRGDTSTSALAQRNQFATNQQDLSIYPQLADYKFHVEPCVKLIEIPLFKKKIRMLDSPANDMIAIPFQYIDNSKRIGFNMRYESFNQMRPYPVSITKEDRQMHLDYLNSRDILLGGKISEQAIAQQRYIEVYRTDKKPTSFADFEDRLVDTIDLKIEDSYYTFPDAIHIAKIPTNKKFYYVFRYVTENLSPGHMSQILECELIDDGNYIYSKFNVLFDELSEEVTLIEPTKTLKKIFQLEPNISQISLDTSEVDFSKTSRDQINNLKIGTPDIDLIWDKKFKVRLTSKKTGKQIDLNVKYELKDEDRINIESGNAAIQLSGLLTSAEKLDRFGFLLGLSIGGNITRPGAETFYMGHDDDDLIDAYGPGPWDEPHGDSY